MKDLHTLDKFRLTAEERRICGINGGSDDGFFKVYVNGRSFKCIASNGGGWEHVSVSPWSEKRKSCPTWDEMCAIKDLFFE